LLIPLKKGIGGEREDDFTDNFSNKKGLSSKKTKVIVYGGSCHNKREFKQV
jgi:hypothetical protein